jgi:predicted RNase H-like nuclease (RuvC/YqgF family)
LASLSSKKSSDELKLGIEKLKQEKMELMLSLNQLEYEMKLKEKINSDNVKELQTIVKEKDAEIKRQKSIANEYKTRSNNAMKSLNPTSQNKPVKKVNVKPDVQMKSERSGSRFRIVDGATVFMD